MSMDQRQYEQLSAWMDAGTAGAGTAMSDRLLSDGELSQVWERYHLIGDVLRNEMAPIDHASLTAAIHDRLREEPTILAPSVSRLNPTAHHATRMRWAAGMAMAASVAAIVIIGVTRVEQQSGADIAQTGSATVERAPINLAAASRPSAPERDVTEPAVDSKINRYLADHSKFVASGGSLNGMVPLVTLISHNE